MSVNTLPLSALSVGSRAPRLSSFAKTKADLIRLSQRITHDGLLNPLRVARSGNRYIVLDGKKRLMALKLLAKKNLLPRSLVNVPVIMDEAELAPLSRPALMSDPALARALTEAHVQGHSPQDIIERFDCRYDTLNMALSLRGLHPQIFEYFESGHLTLEQAAAFATLPNMDAQWRLLQKLGPFSRAQTVIDAILAGQTTIEMPDGDVMIMPSRNPAPKSTHAEPSYKIAA